MLYGAARLEPPGSDRGLPTLMVPTTAPLARHCECIAPNNANFGDAAPHKYGGLVGAVDADEG